MKSWGEILNLKDDPGVRSMTGSHSYLSDLVIKSQSIKSCRREIWNLKRGRPLVSEAWPGTTAVCPTLALWPHHAECLYIAYMYTVHTQTPHTHSCEQNKTGRAVHSTAANRKSCPRQQFLPYTWTPDAALSRRLHFTCTMYIMCEGVV